MAIISPEEVRNDLLSAESLPDIGSVEEAQTEQLQLRDDLISVGGGEDAGVLDKLVYGFNKMPSDLQNLALLSEAAGYTVANMVGAGMPEGESFQGHYGPLLMFDQQREILKRERDDRITQNDAGMVEGTQSQNSWWVTGGNLAGAISTPTSLVPVGQSYRAAALIGAGLGAWDATLYSLAQEGQIDGENVAIAATLGFVIAPLIMAGGNKVASFFKRNQELDIPVTERDIDEMVSTFNIRDKIIGESKDLAEHINNTLGIGKGRVRTKKQAKKDMVAALSDDPEMTAFFVRYADNEDALRNIAKNQKEKDIDKAWELNGNKDDLLKKIQIEKSWRDKNTAFKISKEKDVDTYISNVKKEVKTRNQNQLDIAEDPKQGIYINNPAMERAFQTATSARDVSVESFKQGLNQQAGFMSQDIMNSLASASVGAIGGYAYDQSPEGAIFGATLGLGLPWAIGRTYKSIGKLGKRDTDSIMNHFGSEYLIQRPSKKFENLGGVGKAFSKMLTLVQENIDLRTAGKMIDVEKLLKKYDFNKVSNTARHEVAAILNKTLDPSLATKGARRVASLIQNDFVDVIKEAISVGVLTRKKGAELLSKAQKDGYWPRVYNEAFLSTKAGKEKWVEVFTKQKWDKESLQSALKTITGESKEYISNFINLAKKDGDFYTITRKQAIKMWESRGKSIKTSRSGHLEHDRKIFVDNEDILKPFLVDEPHAVLTEYFHDIYKRIEMAKMFGAKDEVAQKIFEKMEEKFGAAVTDSARTIYYTVAGDNAKSSIIAAHNKQSMLSKTILGKINAFETLKLTFAQTINMGQAIVNGSTLVAKRTGSVSSGVKALVTGIKGALSKEGYEFAERSGAAIETTLLEVMGEMSQNIHSIAGRELTGIARPLEILNNPTKFLKATGFIRVEKFQRTLGANMGKAYAEDLLSKKSVLLSSPKIPKNIKKLDKINKQLDELGIDSGVNPSKVPEGQMLRAGLRFSNEINFRNTPDKLPIAWQSPYASIFRKLKTFSFHHGAFIKDNVLVPATKGNLAPLMTYLAVGTPMGMSVDEFRRWIKGDDSELTMTKRIIRGFSSVGGIGIAMDMVYSSAFSKQGLIASTAGVVASDVSSVAYGIATSVSGSIEKGKIDWKPAARSLSGTVVYPGQKYVTKKYLNRKKEGSIWGMGSSLGDTL